VLNVFSCLLRSQVIAGVFQSTGWPSVVSIMANWYGKGKRGLVMGIWNAHTSLGNIMGTVIAAACLQYGWGYAFIVPGVMISLLGLVVFAVLVVQPSDVGLGGSYEPVKSAEAVSWSMGNVTAAARWDG
jgi:OPA family glycerol-3-phosphate transporter-like MFS transporter 1/2